MNDYETRQAMIGAGYWPQDRKAGFSADELQAYRNGLALYPNRPYPPLVFGFEMLPHSRLPKWVHVDDLPSTVATGKDGHQVVLYKVPMNPPASVIREHEKRAKAAAERIEYVDVNSRRADTRSHWSDVDSAGDDR